MLLVDERSPFAAGVQGTQFDIDSMQVTSDDVSQCTPSVQCSSWHDEAAAVVAIYAIDMRLGAMGLCTGTVVNAPQGRRYLLTADHCFIGERSCDSTVHEVLAGMSGLCINT